MAALGWSLQMEVDNQQMPVEEVSLYATANMLSGRFQQAEESQESSTTCFQGQLNYMCSI